MTDAPPVHVPHHGGNNLTGSLGHKLGPLPVWVWGLVGGLAFGAVYYVHKKKADAAKLASTQNSGSAFGSTDSSSNGGNAGELATTGGSAGMGGANQSLAQWAANAVNWLIGQGTSPSDATNALSAYINGATLTPDQTTLVNQALANFGAPPSGILPVNTASTPAATVSDDWRSPPAGTIVLTDYQRGGIFLEYPDGTEQNLTPQQWAVVSTFNLPNTTVGSPPAAAAAPAAAPAPAPAAAAGRTYKVQPGDTYWSIAQRFYGSPSNANIGKLEAANPYPARSIPVGATLNIPA